MCVPIEGVRYFPIINHKSEDICLASKCPENIKKLKIFISRVRERELKEGSRERWKERKEIEKREKKERIKGRKRERKRKKRERERKGEKERERERKG